MSFSLATMFSSITGRQIPKCCPGVNGGRTGFGYGRSMAPWHRRATGIESATSRGEPTKTIAHARAGGGETVFTVHCLGVGCYHQSVKTFEELWLAAILTSCRMEL